MSFKSQNRTFSGIVDATTSRDVGNEGLAVARVFVLPVYDNQSPTSDLDERFLKILKIFKWGPDAEKAIEVLLLKVDHRLVREVLSLM